MSVRTPSAHLLQLSYFNFENFLFLAPRVSRVSVEFRPLGFLQLIEEFLHLTMVILNLQGLLLVVISPTKDKVASLA
jgi:hypothetical protein